MKEYCNCDIEQNDVYIQVDETSKLIIDDSVQMEGGTYIKVINSSSIQLLQNVYIGKNCLIQSLEGSKLMMNSVWMGNNSEIFLIFSSNLNADKDVLIQRNAEIAAFGGNIRIGEKSTFATNLEMRCHNTDIIIGNDNMFAQYCKIIAGDGHQFYDNLTNELLTHKEPIITDEHVWIGVGVTMLSKCHVHNGSILGASSVVNGEVPSNVIVVGSPYRIIRENVRWER